MSVTVKKAFDELFSDIQFNKKLYLKILYNNISFITNTRENKNLFGSKLIGNHLVSYTYYDKNIFFDEVFDMTDEDVTTAINKITTINKNFSVARDSVNLTCFYVAHRFLSNKELKEKDRIEYAKEILNYFNYRTLVLISSNFFKYPISEEKAISLNEKLSNRFLIKRLKNWKEYCQYRSDEYVKSKFNKLLISFKDDENLPNAITDLFNRTKDTLKNIYRIFLDMLENDEVISSKKSVITDLEGKQILMDRLGNADTYITRVENVIIDTSSFIKEDYILLVTDIIKNVNYDVLKTTLTLISEYSFTGNKELILINSIIRDIFVTTISYLQNNKVFIHSNTNVLTVLNYLVGNVLYSRTSDQKLNTVKDNLEKLIKSVYKKDKKQLPVKQILYVRNSVFIYIFMYPLLD